MKTQEDFLQKRVEDGIYASAHLNRGFHVPPMKVSEGLGDVVGDVLHATVNADVPFPLLLFVWSCRSAGVEPRLKTCEVAAAAIHGCPESRENDRSVCGRSLIFSRSLWQIW